MGYLSKTTLADDFEHLVAVGYVVVWNVDVRPLIVIVTAVIGSTNYPQPLLGIRTDKEH